MTRLRWLLLLSIWMAAFQSGAVPTYTVGVEDIDLSPFYAVRSSDNTYTGYARDVLDRFAKSQNVHFVYVPLPVKRFQVEYWNGKLDFAFPDNPEWNKDQKKNLKIMYSEPVLSFHDTVLVFPDRVGQGLNRLKSLGTIRGFTLWKFQKQIDEKKLRIESAPDPASVIQMLFSGRVDAINLPLQIATCHLKKMNRVGAIVPDPGLMPIESSSYYFSSIRYPQIIKNFNLFLKKEANSLSRLRKDEGL